MAVVVCHELHKLIEILKAHNNMFTKNDDVLSARRFRESANLWCVGLHIVRPPEPKYQIIGRNFSHIMT